MTEQHPITPPPELVEQWCSETEYATPGRVALHTISEQRLFQLLTRSAQWGYDQRGEVNEAKLQQARDEELEACCEWLADETPTNYINALRAARRPKPQITLDEALNLVKFEFIGGEWRVKNVNGDVYGIVEGILHGTINGRTWQFVETPKAKLKRLISKGADKAQLLEAFNQLEVN